MKIIRRMIAIACAIALALGSIVFAGAAEDAGTDYTQTVKVGDRRMKGKITADTQTVIRIEVPAGGEVRLIAEGENLQVTVCEETEGVTGAEVASGNTYAEGALYLNWTAKAGNYLALLSMPVGTEGKYAFRVLDNRDETESDEEADQPEEAGQEEQEPEQQGEEEPAAPTEEQEPKTEQPAEPAEEQESAEDEPETPAEEQEEPEAPAEEQEKPETPAEEQEPAAKDPEETEPEGKEPEAPASEEQPEEQEPEQNDPESGEEEPAAPASEPENGSEEEEQQPEEQPEEEPEEEQQPEQPEQQEEQPAEEPEQPEKQPEGDPEEQPAEQADEPSEEEPAEEQKPGGEQPEDQPAEPQAEAGDASEEPDEPENDPEGEPAQEEPADEPTDETGEPEEDEGSDIIATLKSGENWAGILKRNTVAFLKADTDGQAAYALVEGKSIWAGVCQADGGFRQEETDAETQRVLLTIVAGSDSCLIALGTNDDVLMEKASVTLMDEETYRNWANEGQPDGQPEEQADELQPERTVQVISSLDDMAYVTVGTEVELRAELSGFTDADRYTVQWQYTPDGGKTFVDAEGANELVYHYSVDKQNYSYAWRLAVNLLPADDADE